MFETLCALLLRLYPADFRRAYGEAALQLVRDRARHERGFLRRLRLLADLTADLCSMSLREWRPASPALARVDDGPRFDIIETRGPRPEAMAAGVVISMLALGSFTFLFQPATFADGPLTVGKGSSNEPAGFPSKDDDGHQAVVNTGDERHDLIVAIAANLQQRYYDRAIGAQLAGTILTFEKDGRYQAVATGPDLAQRITDDIHSTSNAIGIAKGTFVADVIYSERAMPAGPPPAMMPMPDPNPTVKEYRDCLFSIVERRDGNIGYFKINGFDASCAPTAAKAMASFNGVSALVIDLRDNGGGVGDLALLIGGYFFDRPALFWDPRPGSPVPPKTASPVASNKLADTPVYLVTSSRTQSAAEYFAYNLKMLKRVTIVGERTAGHEHAGAFRRVTDHIGMGVQEAPPPENPYAIKGWEVIGVEPDVEATRAEAPEVAKKLAAAKTRR